MNLTLQHLLEEGTEELSKAGVEEASLDSRYLLFEAFRTDMVHFLIDRNREASG
jgi:release factor glutamine methyltransferase